MLNYVFRTPYLDEDTGANLGGGGTPTDTAGQQTDTQTADTTVQGGEQQTQQTQTEQPKFKVKFNHEEKELTYDEAIQYAQKGMNYDRIYPEYEKLRNNPHLSYLEQKAQRLGMSVEQLIENDRKYEEQQKLNELIQQNIPEEYAKKLLEHDKVMKEYQTEKQTREQTEAKQKMFAEFLEAYPEFYDPNKSLPPEVQAEISKGRHPIDAYVRYENKLLKEQLQGAQKQQQTQEANEKNAASSTGSVKTSGKTGGFISKDDFEANKHDMNWVRKNLNTLSESRKHW
jgi:hypothetical protein